MIRMENSIQFLHRIEQGTFDCLVVMIGYPLFEPIIGLFGIFQFYFIEVVVSLLLVEAVEVDK